MPRQPRVTTMSKKKTKPIPRDHGIHGNTPPEEYLRQRYVKVTFRFPKKFAEQLAALAVARGGKRFTTRVVIEAVRRAHGIPDDDQ